jgi:hypothetical protein
VAPGGAAGAAPAIIRRGPAVRLAGDARGVVLGWLGAGLGRSWGGAGRRRGERRQPLRAQFRRGGQRGGAARKGGSTSGC